MKYLVRVTSTSYSGYEVEADSEKEAEKLANKLHNNPETADSPVVDWDYEAELVESWNS